jgi:ribosome assembly protein SQT1
LTKTPKYAAVGAYDGAIVVYDPVSGAKIQELEGPSDVEFLCFHPKGGSVLLAGSAEDGTVWMYHLPTSKCMQVFVGHESGVTAGVFTPDGRWALSCSSDGTLRIWAPRTGVSKHVFRLGEGAGLTCLATNGGSDGQLVLVGSEDGAAYVCHVGNKKVVATLRHFELPSPHGDDDKQMELPMGVEAVGFASPALNSSWCATGGQDGILKIWDLNTGQCRQVCRNALPEAQSGNSGNKVGGITRLQWHPSLPLVYTASADGVIRVWDARNGTLVSSFTGHTDVINDLNVEVFENNSVLISASDDNSVRVFEVDHTQALKS